MLVLTATTTDNDEDLAAQIESAWKTLERATGVRFTDLGQEFGKPDLACSTEHLHATLGDREVAGMLAYARLRWQKQDKKGAARLVSEARARWQRLAR